MSVETTWDDVFGDLDARSLSPDERLGWINAEIRKALNGRSWTSYTGGDEAELTWQAAVDAFAEGIWAATIHCCHAVCERELAGSISTFLLAEDDRHSTRLERMGLGRALTLASEQNLLPELLVEELRKLTDLRKPYGHWRAVKNEDNLFWRAQNLAEQVGTRDINRMKERLVVQDATEAMRITIKLYFGNYGLGG